jgi:hypothetical protein
MLVSGCSGHHLGGQLYAEDAAAVAAGPDHQASSVPFGDASHDVQAEAASGRAGGAALEGLLEHGPALRRLSGP